MTPPTDNTRARTNTTPGAEGNSQATGGDSLLVVDPATARFQAQIAGYAELLHAGATGTTGQVTTADYRPGAYSVPLSTDYRGPYSVPVDTTAGPLDAVRLPQRRDGADAGDRRTTVTALDASIDPSKQYRDVAMQAMQQLDGVLAKYRKPDGSPTGVPVSEADKRQIADYQRTMTENFERALVLTGGATTEQALARQQQIANQIDAFTSTTNGQSKEGLRQALCQQYGLDANNVSVDDINQRLQAATTPEDRGFLTQLAALETQREQLIAAQLAPCLVRAQMGRAFLVGDFNPDATGAVSHQVPFEQVNKGAKLVGDVNQLDASGTLRATDEFQRLLRLANQEIGQGMRLTQGTAGGGGQGDAGAGVGANPNDATRAGTGQTGGADTRIQQMLDDMNKAAQAEKDGNADVAMKAHEDANQIANALSKSLVPQYMKDLANQTDPTVQQQMLTTIMLVERQRMDEAAYLQRRSQHQPDDYARSLSLLNDARGEWAALEKLNPSHYGANAGNEAWPSLSADPTFNQMLNKALTGGKTLDGDLTQTGTRIQAALDGKHYEALFQAVTDAQRIAGNWPTTEMKTNITQMQQHQTELQSQLAQTQADQTLSADAKAARVAAIQAQIASGNQMIGFDQNKLNQKDQLVYLEGYADYLRGSEHYAEAHQKLTEFMQTDLYKNATPEQKQAWGLEDQTGPDGKPVHGLVWATDPANQPNWWQRNMGWIAPVAGVIVGAAVAAGTFYLGPGAALTGTAAGTAVAGALAIGAGTLAGAGAYTGAKWSAGEQVNAGTFVDGLKWGALGATIAVAPGMTSKFGLEFAATNTLAGIAQRGALGAATSIPYASMQAVDDVYHGQSAGRTALNFGETVGFSALTGGLPLGSATSKVPIWGPISRFIAPAWSTPASVAITVPALQAGIPITIGAVRQQFVDASDYLHGGNDPSNPNDQVNMSQLAAQNPINLQLPDGTPRTDDPNQ